MHDVTTADCSNARYESKLGRAVYETDVLKPQLRHKGGLEKLFVIVVDESFDDGPDIMLESC